ncbi:hypothetical protein Scani_46480 [Streptomyces caniferus]|uniref:Uncharacterized protein n=1 Tax=Streptomyces caniferus TaxID=285557 RepID=A0A640SB61_9ACTN|nr:hypothetical protein Scani_46480 [Streptomyces caniferus]
MEAPEVAGRSAGHALSFAVPVGDVLSHSPVRPAGNRGCSMGRNGTPGAEPGAGGYARGGCPTDDGEATLVPAR